MKTLKRKEDVYLGKDARWEESEGKLIFNVDFDTVLSWDPNYDPEEGDFWDDSPLMMNLGFNNDNS